MVNKKSPRVVPKIQPVLGIETTGAGEDEALERARVLRVDVGEQRLEGAGFIRQRTSLSLDTATGGLRQSRSRLEDFKDEELLNSIPAKKLMPQACQNVIVLIPNISGISQFHRKYVGMAVTTLTMAKMPIARMPRTIPAISSFNQSMFLPFLKVLF